MSWLYYIRKAHNVSSDVKQNEMGYTKGYIFLANKILYIVRKYIWFIFNKYCSDIGKGRDF